MRRSIFARVKFLSRLFTALNLLPSIATLASMNRPMVRQSAIKVAVDVELQQYRRMIRRPAGCLRIHPVEPKFGQTEFVDKDVDYANRIVLADPVFKAFRKQ